jgi:hypothetical protein
MTQIKQVGFEALADFDDLAGQLHQPERLRHLTGTGLVVPARHRR